MVAPDGRALPCHGATVIDTLRFENVRERSLDWIWHESEAFRAFRGEDWMQPPCRGCARRAVDYGGCRCQAFALTGDASSTDPVCALAPARELIDVAVGAAGEAASETLVYRRYGHSGASGSRLSSMR